MEVLLNVQFSSSFLRRGILSRKMISLNRQIFEDFFRDPFFSRWSAKTSPIRTDVRETEKEYIIEAEMPELKKRI